MARKTKAELKQFIADNAHIRFEGDETCEELIEAYHFVKEYLRHAA